MSAKKKKSEAGQAVDKNPVAAPAENLAKAVPAVEAVRDPKIASISSAEYKRMLQSAKSPVSLACVELLSNFSAEKLPARTETGKGAWLEPSASMGTQTIRELSLQVEGRAVTFNVHADTHFWAVIDLVQRVEKGEPLVLIAKSKNDESVTRKLGTMRNGKPELVKNLQFYTK